MGTRGDAIYERVMHLTRRFRLPFPVTEETTGNDPLSLPLNLATANIHRADAISLCFYCSRLGFLMIEFFFSFVRSSVHLDAALVLNVAGG